MRTAAEKAADQGPHQAAVSGPVGYHAIDLPAREQKHTFGVVKAAHARGGFQVMVERGRRALRVHLGSDVAAGLRVLRRAIMAALKHRARWMWPAPPPMLGDGADHG